jgi:hypothetical protein
MGYAISQRHGGVLRGSDERPSFGVIAVLPEGGFAVIFWAFL